ncbi:MAG: M48 family metallopeptidase [Xanthomonadales bacterium]|nr:M48 family metallopeptidase [Xanthomonadales bacterium]
MRGTLKRLVIGAILMAAGVAQAQEPMAWKIRDLIQSPEATIELRDPRGRVIRQLDVRQLVYIYAVMSALEEASEITGELYIIAGDSPNAFAGAGRSGENIYGLNFGMLDLIGDDVHAAAAILGHEMAHLKLNHAEDARRAQSRPAGPVFSAADTRYSRDNERDADYLGMIWTIEAGYDPAGAVRVHEKLYKLSKTRAGSFVGSHPSSIERITVLKSLARRMAP